MDDATAEILEQVLVHPAEILQAENERLLKEEELMCDECSKYLEKGLRVMKTVLNDDSISASIKLTFVALQASMIMMKSSHGEASASEWLHSHADHAAKMEEAASRLVLMDLFKDMLFPQGPESNN